MDEQNKPANVCLTCGTDVPKLEEAKCENCDDKSEQSSTEGDKQDMAQ